MCASKSVLSLWRRGFVYHHPIRLCPPLVIPAISLRSPQQTIITITILIIIILPAIIIIIIEMILIVMVSLPPLIMSQLQTLPITLDSIPTTTTSLASPSIAKTTTSTTSRLMAFILLSAAFSPPVAPHTPPSDHITTHITPSPSHQLSFRTT